ncbi:demethoxyubiquinone hydroxylase family protein, partial [Acinetobacter variabilis]
PAQDERSRRILEQMNEDELHHRDTALAAGGVDLPLPVKIAMTGISKLMTKTSYYI